MPIAVHIGYRLWVPRSDAALITINLVCRRPASLNSLRIRPGRGPVFSARSCRTGAIFGSCHTGQFNWRKIAQDQCAMPFDDYRRASILRQTNGETHGFQIHRNGTFGDSPYDWRSVSPNKYWEQGYGQHQRHDAERIQCVQTCWPKRIQRRQ